MPESLLTLPEVAARLRVSQKSVRRLIASGDIPVQLVGGAYRFRETDIDAYLNDHRVASIGNWFAPVS